MEKRCYSAGRWTDEGEILEVRSPYDGELAGEALRPSGGVVEEALQASADAFRRTRAMAAFLRPVPQK